jgi:molybdopterin synthase catalytic subunit
MNTKKTGIHHGKEEWVSLDEIQAVLWEEKDIVKVGGVFTFSANTKDTAMDGSKQSAISVDVENKKNAEQQIAQIIKDIEKHELIHSAALHMNEGVLHPKDDILHIMIAGVQDAPQVRQMYDLVLEILNRLKRETSTRFKEFTEKGAEYYQPEDPTKTFD